MHFQQVVVFISLKNSGKQVAMSVRFQCLKIQGTMWFEVLGRRGIFIECHRRNLSFAIC